MVKKRRNRVIKLKKIGAFALTAILISSMVIITGCDRKEDTKSNTKTEKKAETEEKKETKTSGYSLDDVVVTIDDTKIKMKEMMYYIYQSEQEGNYYESVYHSLADSEQGFWDSEFEKGKTNREAIKEETMDACILYELFGKMAEQKGYTLTKDENKSAKADAKELYKSLTDKQKKTMGLTAESITKIQKKILLGNKYYEKVMKGIKIDEEAVKKSVDEEQYRQYDVDYIYIPTVNYDENYNPVELTGDDKQKVYDTIKALLPKALKGRKFDDLVGKKETQLESGSISFVKGDNLYGEEFEETALKLKKGEVADKIIEGDDGYYIIKMVDDNSKESYESEVENAIVNAKNEEFQKQFDKIKEEHKISINTSVWDSVELGSITYDEAAQPSNKEPVVPESEDSTEE